MWERLGNVFSWVPHAGVDIGSMTEEEREMDHGDRRQSPPWPSYVGQAPP